MGDKKQRRPPTVTEWVVDDDFHSRLDGLVKSKRFKTNAALARFLSEQLAYEIDPSTISNLRRRVYPTSGLAGPICDVFGWPHPPVSTVDTEASVIVSQLLEVVSAGGASRADVEAYIKAAVEQKRRFHKLVRGTPGADER